MENVFKNQEKAVYYTLRLMYFSRFAKYFLTYKIKFIYIHTTFITTAVTRS